MNHCDTSAELCVTRVHVVFVSLNTLALNNIASLSENKNYLSIFVPNFTNYQKMSKPIQLSEAASIGIHALVLISTSEGSFMNVNVIAEKTGASKNHIAKVMQTLVRADFVSSVRGPAGGFGAGARRAG